MVEIVASCYAVETMAQILCYQGRSQEFFGRWLKVFKNVGHHAWPRKIVGFGTAEVVHLDPFQSDFASSSLSFLAAVLFHIP